MTPWFIATGTFGPWSGESWTKYVQWSGLTQLDELVSLDGMLNPTVLKQMKEEYWSYVPEEDHMFGLFADLQFLRNEIAGLTDVNLLCVYRNPPIAPDPPKEAMAF